MTELEKFHRRFAWALCALGMVFNIMMLVALYGH